MTDKEKLYAVKNDKGEWLSFDSSHESVWDTNNPTFFKDKIYAEAQKMGRKANVVTLTEEQKVKLPREVGEYLEDWLKANSIDTIITDLVYYEGDHMAVRDWWDLTPDATYLIADMARYGWEAEPEAKWYVKTPEAWESEDGDFGWLYKSIYGGVDTTSHGDGEENEQFTRAEIKQYHLDSDIFTLVPVGEDK
jgi:hypothetical protein